jgi:hypothetical protein
MKISHSVQKIYREIVAGQWTIQLQNRTFSMSFLKRVPGRFAPITCSHRVDSPHLFAIISSPDPLVRWAIVTTERPSSVRPLTFHILINSSEATGPIWTKLWWNGPWMAPSKIVNKSYNIQNTGNLLLLLRNSGRFAPNPVCPASRFAPIPFRPGSFHPHLLIVL